MRGCILGLFAVLAATPAWADFQLDLDAPALKKAAGVIELGDLAVGETGIVNFPSFCIDGKTLTIGLDTVLVPKLSALSSNYRITREPGGKGLGRHSPTATARLRPNQVLTLPKGWFEPCSALAAK